MNAAYLASPLARFRPWVAPSGAAPQRDFLAAFEAHRKVVYRGGNRSGKSCASVVNALLRVEGYHPHARVGCPQRGWLSALDWEFGVGQVLWPVMKPWIDWRRVRGVHWLRKQAPELPATLTWRCGCEISFKSAEAGASKYQGAELSWVGIDEEHEQDVVEEARARLLRTGGDLWVTLTPVARKAWVLDLEREAGTRVVRASMRDAMEAGLLDRQGVEDYLASLPERQRRVRELGDFVALEGLVYPELDRALHVVRPRGDALVDAAGAPVAPWPLPPTWPRHAGIDFGMDHPTAVVLLARDPATDAYLVERVVCARMIRPATWARLLRGAAHDGDGLLPPLAAPLAADHDLAACEELRAGGVATAPARKELQAGIDAVACLLTPGVDGRPRLRLVVEDPPPTHPAVGRLDALSLLEELEGYRYPRDRAGNAARDLPLKKKDDRCLAAGTAVLTAEGPRPIEELAGGEPVMVAALDAEGAWAWREARASATGEARLVEVAWDGGALLCTADHAFLTEAGWLPAAFLAGHTVACPPRERRQEGQPPREPAVPVAPGAHAWAHDARTPAGGGAPGLEGSGAGGAGVACLGGGAGVARRTREENVGEDTGAAAARADVRELHANVRNGRDEVQRARLLGDVPGRPRAGRADGLDEARAGGGPVRGADARRALSELAARGDGTVPLAWRRVRAVRPAGRGAVFNLVVPAAGHYVAAGVVVGNCDALRYAVMAAVRRRLGEPPDLGLGLGGALPTRSFLGGALPPRPGG